MVRLFLPPPAIRATALVLFHASHTRRRLLNSSLREHYAHLHADCAQCRRTRVGRGHDCKLCGVLQYAYTAMLEDGDLESMPAFTVHFGQHTLSRDDGSRPARVRVSVPEEQLQHTKHLGSRFPFRSACPQSTDARRALVRPARRFFLVLAHLRGPFLARAAVRQCQDGRARTVLVCAACASGAQLAPVPVARQRGYIENAHAPCAPPVRCGARARSRRTLADTAMGR
jgi:hypothetical protein